MLCIVAANTRSLNVLSMSDVVVVTEIFVISNHEYAHL